MSIVALLGVALAGCETAGGLLNTPTSTAETPAAPAPSQQILGRVALAPIIGAPEGIAKQMQTQLTQTGEQKRVAILPDRDPNASYTLRGYVVASRDKAGTKLSYIWDVADGSGKRVNRITGEEIAPAAPNAKDPWAAVTPAIVQSIADKTISSLATWLPTQQPGSAATPVAAAPAGSPPPASGAGAGSVPAPVTPVAAQPGRPPATSNQQTAALPTSNEVVAVGPVVAGAPGDGNTALAAALQRELSRQGVTMADRPGAYRVEGQVTIGAAKDGRQPIQIDWRVKDAQGKSLGTVSQKNEIPPGSLDGTWGKTADAAAAAAAQGIVKLLPQPRSTN